MAVQILTQDNEKLHRAYLVRLQHYTTRQRARNLRQPRFLSNIDTRVPSAQPYPHHEQQMRSTAGPLLGQLVRHSGNLLNERKQGSLARLRSLLRQRVPQNFCTQTQDLR